MITTENEGARQYGLTVRPGAAHIIHDALMPQSSVELVSRELPSGWDTCIKHTWPAMMDKTKTPDGPPLGGYDAPLF